MDKLFTISENLDSWAIHIGPGAPPFVSFHADGRITLGQRVRPDTAAVMFLDALRKHWAHLTEKHRMAQPAPIPTPLTPPNPPAPPTPPAVPETAAAGEPLPSGDEQPEPIAPRAQNRRNKASQNRRNKASQNPRSKAPQTTSGDESLI